MPFKKNSYENWEGPVEQGSDGKWYAKGQAPHSKKYYDEQRAAASNTSSEDTNWHSTIGSSSSSQSPYQSLFNEHGLKAKSPEQAYKEMKKRIKDGRMPFTDEAVRFFTEMGWYDLIDLARRFVRPDPYSDENADWTYHYERNERRNSGLGRIFGIGKSEAQVIAENIFRSMPDITAKDKLYQRIHPDRMPEQYRQLANDTIACLNALIDERNKNK